MKKYILAFVQWFGSLFFLVSAILFCPEVVSIFLLALGLSFLPVTRWQNWLETKLHFTSWPRIIVTVVLIILAVVFFPGNLPFLAK